MATKTTHDQSTGIWRTIRQRAGTINDARSWIPEIQRSLDGMKAIAGIEQAVKGLLESHGAIFIPRTEQSLKEHRSMQSHRWGFIARGLLKKHPDLSDASDILDIIFDIRKHIDNPVVTHQVIAKAIELGIVVARLKVRPCEPLVIQARKSEAEKHAGGINSGEKRKAQAEAKRAAIRSEHAALKKRYGGNVSMKFIYSTLGDTLKVSERTIRDAIKNKSPATN